MVGQAAILGGHYMNPYDKSSDTKLATQPQTEESALDGGNKTVSDTSPVASEGKQANPGANKKRRWRYRPWNATECNWCGTELTPETSLYTHDVPLDQGGTMDITNVVAVCEACYQASGRQVLCAFRFH
jgi:hypothetical protein